MPELDAPRVEHPRPVEAGQLRALLGGADPQPLEDFADDHIQHVEIAVLDLHRNAERAVRTEFPRAFRRTHADPVACIRAELADHLPAECVHQHRAIAPFARHQFRIRGHRTMNARQRANAIGNRAAGFHRVRTVGQRRIKAREAIQRERRRRQVAAVDRPVDLVVAQAARIGHHVLHAHLHRMVGQMVIGDRRADRLRAGQHPDMLAGTVAAHASRRVVALDPRPVHRVGQRRMAAAAQIRFVRGDLLEHRARALDVTVLAAVRRAHERDVRVVEAEAFRRARLDHRQRLGRLGRRPRERDPERIAEPGQQPAACIDDRHMGDVRVLDRIAAVCDDCCAWGVHRVLSPCLGA